ncbi:MAG: acyclic terpene utilization AtuA family protein [Firmicutes bacterium]|nr:acyclic terpene utilization AtuA family protein [Bacillota bacterium]
MKIMSLCGLLGYGYEEASLEAAKKMGGIDYIGVDAGSTDPGPCYLGKGTSFTNRSAVKRDVELVLPWAISEKIPFIIGTGGGSGADVHVEWLKEIIEEIAAEKGLKFKMAVINTEVSADYVLEKFRAGKISEMGPGLELTEENIKKCSHIVSQIGIDPFIKALETGADVILAGRACDTAIYSAPAIMNGVEEGVAAHMAKIMECGGLCAEPMAAADCMLATVEKDSFTLEPFNPKRICNVSRAAAHTMYEQGNPYYIYEPDGYADLRESKYEQVTERAVKVSNSKFVKAEKPTLKLEGAMLAGYRTFSVATINDPLTIKNVDYIFDIVKGFVAKNMEGKLSADDYSVTLRKFGTPLPGTEVPDLPTCNMGVIIDVIGKTQEIANTVCALCRSRMLHTDYPGRKSSAGNLAFAFSPSDVQFGPVYVFGIYHLAEVDDLCETSRISVVEVGA